MSSNSCEQRLRVCCEHQLPRFEEGITNSGMKRRRTMPELPALYIPKETHPNTTKSSCLVSGGRGGNESSDSGMFSEEEELFSGSFDDKKEKKKWLLSVVNYFGLIFKAETDRTQQIPHNISTDFDIKFSDTSNSASNMAENLFTKDASYYCVSPACQTFAKNKGRLPSKDRYSNGNSIPHFRSNDIISKEEDDGSLAMSAIRECFKPQQHSCVWIELLPDILPYDSVYTNPPKLQIKHSCSQLAINYRGDLSSKISSFNKADKNQILWYRYLGRQVESDLVKSLDEEETNFLSLKLRHLSRQVCGRCGSGFSMLFNRRLQCSSCQLGVCKNCCKKLTSDGNWICDACTEQRELQRQSCEWFYDHLHKSFNDFGSAKIMKSISHNDHMNIVDENSSQVRDHIEKVVEALIGDNIDQVNINRLVNDPQYDGLFKNYHDKLSDALAGLVLAIQLVMENRTIEDENTTPTTAHIKLKNLINQLIIDAGKFKKGFMVTPETLHHSFRPQEEENSYEDLLATAIINKVVTSTRQKFRGQSNNNCIKNKRKSLSEEDMNGSSEESGRGASESPSSTPPVVLTSYYEEDSFSCGSCKYEDTLSNESEESPWIGDRGQGQKYTIKEEIEEVTTTVYDDDEITEKTIVRKNPKILSSVSCPTLNSLDSILLNECDSEFNVTYHHTNVPFPELGLDVTNVLNDPSSTQAHPKNNGWEENWLFKKQSHHPSNFVKLSALVRLLSDDPISMLVPNPNEDLRPQIGTRDVDEISELSERNSVGSIEFSTSSEEESESELDKTIKTKRSFKVSVSKTDVLKGTTTTLGSTAVLREGDVEYPQECDVEHTEFSVPAEVKKSFTDRGNVEFVTLPCVESSVTSGKILEIHCACSRSVDVAWFRNASPIHNDGLHYEIWRQKKSNSRVEHFLRIYDVRLEDQGDYRVVAYNDDGEKWHDFKVLVQEQSGQSSTPEIISYPDNSHLENEGLSKKFICQVKGHPEPRLVFLKDGKRLNRNENINIEYYNDFGEWSLEIRRLSHRDEGFYEVLAENRVGSCKRSWVLKVRQNPTPPDAKPPPIPSDLDEETKVETSLVNINERQKGSPSPVVVEAANHSVGLTLAEAINPSLVSSCSPVGNQVGERDMKFDKIEEEDSHYPSNPDSIASCSSNSTPPGSIADREHRKWVELAVNMPNNPYSKESIEKRQSLKSLGRNSDGSFMPKLTIDSIQEVQNADNAPSRIYCGLKSVDDSLYRRDYYINKNEEFNSPVHNTSFQKELEFEPINKEKDCLQVGSSLPPNNSLDCRLSQSSSKEDSSRSSFVDEKEDKYEEESEEAEMRSMKINMSELSNEFSSVCSLNEMQDSGMGSSCERSSLQLAGKVEAEILRFQMDIEKVNKEKSEMMDWQMKKIEKRRKCPPKEIGPPRRYYSSMDSLLSITEDSSNSSPDPPPPPSSNMPSFERSISDKTIKNLNKKQVSISENSTVIISCYEDDEDRFDDSAAILPSVKKLVTKFMPSESSESEVKPTIVKTERKSKNRFSCSNIRTSKEIPTFKFKEPIHSLTARSVPRHFREGLKKGLTHFTDKNIKIPGSDSTIHSRNYGNSEEDYYDDDEESSHVIYDSKKKYQSSSVSSNNNTMESTRTPSPEHVGIPASRVRLTPKKRSDVTTTYCYTSDESTNNELYEHKTHHPPPSARRKQIIQQRLQNQI